MRDILAGMVKAQKAAPALTEFLIVDAEKEVSVLQHRGLPNQMVTMSRADIDVIERLVKEGDLECSYDISKNTTSCWLTPQGLRYKGLSNS
jgi:hypothetical protein